MDVERAIDMLAGVRVFVTTREKIKHPEGTDLFDEAIRVLREHLADRHGAGDAEDAARYRFLRECRSDEIYVMAFDPEGDAPCCGGEIMDAAIDAARAGERG